MKRGRLGVSALSAIRRPGHAGRVCLTVASIVAACGLAACVENAGNVSARPAPAANTAADPPPAVPVHPRHSDNQRKIARLAAQREADAFSNVLALGPGDVIEVTVPGVPELTKFMVRVSEDDTISLPLAGELRVGGMSEDGLREAVYQRLEKLVKNPDVQIFVRQYHSRDVAVVGMVQKPGLYSITTRTDTILDMIDEAGGMTAEASSRVLFIPAPRSADAAVNRRRMALSRALLDTRGNGDDPPPAADPVPDKAAADAHDQAARPQRITPHGGSAGLAAAGEAQPQEVLSMLGADNLIAFDLGQAARSGAIDLPVRPGDTIVVPAAGEVMVDGWVQNPGAFRIVPGMTALSAVSAAGGALFSQTGEVLRTNLDGSRDSIPLDLSRVKAGTDRDVIVQAGDVVWVNRSMIGAIPYSFYEIFSKFGTGMYFPTP